MNLENKPKTDTETTWEQFITEILGTFFITYISGMATAQLHMQNLNMTGVAFMIFVTYTISIYAAYKISGAHFNASITLAAVITKHIGVHKFYWYILAQSIGSFTGGLFLLLIQNQSVHISIADNPNFFLPTVDPHWDISNCFTMEMLMTYMMVMMYYVTG